MKSEDIKAFDITQETQETRERYGLNSKFGQGCLLARRLIEHDVRCVEVVKEDGIHMQKCQKTKQEIWIKHLLL